jgi:tRNA-uridine 2-sulfurtransferase
LPTKPGPILSDQGERLGEHVGLAFYTLGQRKGIGIGGSKSGSGEPWFVARKDMAANTLYVVQGHDHPWLQSRSVQSEQAHWIAGTPPPAQTRLAAKTRYRQADAACGLAQSDEASFELVFDAPQWAITPGQSTVVYDGQVCLGGGVIRAGFQDPRSTPAAQRSLWPSPVHTDTTAS